MFTSLKRLSEKKNNSILIVLRSSEIAHQLLEELRDLSLAKMRIAVYLLDLSVEAASDRSFLKSLPIGIDFFLCSFACEEFNVEPNENAHIAGLSLLAQFIDSFDAIAYETYNKGLLTESLSPTNRPINFPIGIDSFLECEYPLEPLRLIAGLVPWTRRSITIELRPWEGSSNQNTNRKTVNITHGLRTDFSNYLRICHEYKVRFQHEIKFNAANVDHKIRFIIEGMMELPAIEEMGLSNPIDLKIY